MSRALAFQLLCGCLTQQLADDRREALQRQAADRDFDWDAFVELASNALVAPALLDAARRNRLAGSLPPAVVDFFDGMTTLNGQRNTEIRAECLDVAALLNKRGVIPVLLKGGAHIMSGLYGDPAYRIMVDLDMLVPEPQLLDSASAMRERGYEILWDNGFPASHHYAPLGRPGGHVSIELHLRPLVDPHGALLTAGEVLGTKVELRLGSVTVAIPSVQARIIHAIVHAQLSNHAYLNGQFSLRELLDYARLCEAYAAEIDWADIRRRFGALRAATALGYHVLTAQALLGVPIASELRPGIMARALFRFALWQQDHPRLQDVRVRALRPLLLFKRTMSSPVLRRKLWRDLGDATWLKRQWDMLRHAETKKP